MTTGQAEGMDIGEVHGLGILMRDKALRLDAISRQVEATVAATRWLGPDGDALRDMWGGHGRRALSAAAEDLRLMSEGLLAEAQEQRAAFGGGGGGHAGSVDVGGSVHALDPDPMDFGTIFCKGVHALLGQEIDFINGFAEQGMSWAVGAFTAGAQKPVDDWKGEGDPSQPGEALPDVLHGAPTALLVWSASSLADLEIGKAPPELAPIVAAATLATANGQGRDVDRPVQSVDVRRSDQLPSRPTTVSQLADMVEGAYDAGDRIENDHVIITAVGSGAGAKYIVAIPGTQDWSGESGYVFDQANNLRLMAGLPNSAEDAVKKAMQAAGVPPGAQVVLIGHSQGGMVGARLTEDADFMSQYHITNLVTFGSPIDTMTVDDPVKALSITNSSDPVPFLDRHHEKDGSHGGWYIVDLETGKGVDLSFSAHELSRYESLADNADESDSDVLEAYMSDFMSDFSGDVTGQTDVTLHRQPLLVSPGGVVP